MNGARSLLLNGLAQTDLDMDHHRLLNLDISNLPIPPIGENFPPTIDCPPSNWLDGWDRDLQAWHFSQPGFDDLRSPTIAVSVAHQKITTLADPTALLDAVNFQTLQNFVSAVPFLNPKAPVKAATTHLLPLLVTLLVIDGYQTVDGDRILVKDQAGLGGAPDAPSPQQNGIYIAHPSTWVRSDDCNENSEIDKAYCLVLGGTQNANTSWVQVTPNPVLGTSPIDFVLFSIGGGGAGGITAGPGLSLVGSVMSALGTAGRISISTGIDIAATYIGQSSITTLGTIASGVWQGAVVAGQYGGTGVSNTGKTISLLAGNLTIDWFGAAVPPANLILRVFGPTDVTLPATGLLASYPTMTGHAGEFLMTDGATSVSWQKPFSVQTYLNVKNAPYFAKGDGVTNDAPAIQQAINDAAGNGVYLPKGVYFCATDIVAAGACSLLGDGPAQSIIKAQPNAISSGILQLSNNAYIRSIGIDGNLTVAVQQVPIKAGIFIQGTRTVIVTDCKIANTSGDGITVSNSDDIRIMDSEIFNCAGYGVNVANSPRTIISRCRIHLTNYSPVWFINSPYSVISSNTVRQGSPVSQGIYALDCDNTVVSGNAVQQCGFGLRIASTPGRGLNSYGINMVGNSVLRNYEGGVSIDMCDGFAVTGNSIVDNGQGGVDNNTYTVEPGVVVDPLNVGSGYQVGDILTLIGGTGTAAKLMVTKIYAGGALYQDYKSDVAVWPITMGVYSTLPTNNVSVSGGHGTGAKFAYTTALISTGGSGYSIGQVLRATSGTFGHPVRVIITGVDGAGLVKTYEILDGGGYSGAGLPVALGFVSENPLMAGSGFTLSPSFGKRYSAAFNGFIPYGVSTMGPMIGGVFGDNIVTGIHYGGVAMLIQDDVAPRSGRSSYLAVTGSTFKNNDNNFKGQTIGNPLDNTYNINSIFANNITYP